MRLLRLTSIICCALALGCSQKARQQQDPAVVARVNGENLSTNDFVDELTRDVSSVESSEPSSPEQLEPYKRALLSSMIDRTLLLQEAKAANVVVAPEYVDREVMRISSDYPAEGFEEALSQGRLSLAQLKQKTQSLLTVEKLFAQQVYPRVAVTEEEIRQYFGDHPSEFMVPEQVHAQQLVVKGLDEAKRIQSQLRGGKKFSDLARKYSLSADAKVGGDLGWFARGVMPQAFDEVSFKLAVGQVSEIVESDYGFHLFKVLERKPTQKRQLADARGEIEVKLLEQKRADAQKEYLRSLREKAQIQINEETLQGITPKTAAAPVETARP